MILESMKIQFYNLNNNRALNTLAYVLNSKKIKVLI